jgi:exonuclease III
VHYRNKIHKDKEQFYEDLRTVVDKVLKSDTVIILGALNANLGKEGVCSGDTGKHNLHEETEMLEMLCEFAFANNMVIMNTHFQHKYTKQPGYLQIKLPSTKLIMY